MTKSKRAQTFDAKRAARFEAAGVRIDLVDPAQVAIGLAGYEDGGENCTLCDHDIKWLFTLDLGLTTGKVASFAPVGSSCIRSWADSLPHSTAQAALLDALKLAEEKADAVKASFREFNRQAEAGKLSTEDRDALIRFLSSPASVRNNTFLADVAAKVEKFSGWASDNQRSAWLKALNRELIAIGRKPLAVLPPSLGSFSQEDQDILKRANALLGDESKLAKLHGEERDALRDIYAKATRYGSFRSDKQRGFFASIVRRGEGKGSERRAPIATGPSTPQQVVGEVPNVSRQAIEEDDGDRPF